MKNVYCVSTKQRGDMKSGVKKSGVSQSKNLTLTFSQARYASAPSCLNVIKSIPTDA